MIDHAIVSSRSLRARLLLFLLGAVVLFAAAQGVIAYRSALQQVDQMFDYQLQQMAASMGTGFVIGPGPGIPEVPQTDDDILIQIWGQDGAQVFRSPSSTLPRMRALLGFSDLMANGRSYRVYTLQTPQQVIQIAQDRSARTARARALAARAALPVALFAPLLMLVVWWVVSRALAPVERMRAQVAARAAADLSPLSLTGLPSEVGPLVGELNALFGRVGQAFDAQKNFVADAAHELRTPLAALKLQAQALRRLPTSAGSGNAALGLVNHVVKCIQFARGSPEARVDGVASDREGPAMPARPRTAACVTARPDPHEAGRIPGCGPSGPARRRRTTNERARERSHGGLKWGLGGPREGLRQQDRIRAPRARRRSGRWGPAQHGRAGD